MQRKTIASLALLSAAVIWGSSFLLVRNTVDSMPVHYLLVFRFTLATALLSFVMRKKLPGINREIVKHGVILGVMLYGTYVLQALGVSSIALGEQATTAGRSAFLACVYCVLTPFVFWFISKKKPDRYSVIAAFLCILGIGILVLSADGTGILTGDLLVLASSFCSALHIVYLGKFLKHSDAMRLTIIQFVTVAVISLAIALAFEPFPVEATRGAWASAIYLGIFCTAVALALQNFGQKHAHPNSSALLLSLEGPFGVLFAATFGGADERLTFRSVVGFAIILCAIVTSETKLKFRASVFR